MNLVEFHDLRASLRHCNSVDLARAFAQNYIEDMVVMAQEMFADGEHEIVPNVESIRAQAIGFAFDMINELKRSTIEQIEQVTFEPNFSVKTELTADLEFSGPFS